MIRRVDLNRFLCDLFGVNSRQRGVVRVHAQVTRLGAILSRPARVPWLLYFTAVLQVSLPLLPLDPQSVLDGPVELTTCWSSSAQPRPGPSGDRPVAVRLRCHRVRPSDQRSIMRVTMLLACRYGDLFCSPGSLDRCALFGTASRWALFSVCLGSFAKSCNVGKGDMTNGYI